VPRPQSAKVLATWEAFLEEERRLLAEEEELAAGKRVFGTLLAGECFDCGGTGEWRDDGYVLVCERCHGSGVVS
jgi:hypothetical protein